MVTSTVIDDAGDMAAGLAAQIDAIMSPFFAASKSDDRIDLASAAFAALSDGLKKAAYMYFMAVDIEKAKADRMADELFQKWNSDVVEALKRGAR